MRRITALHITKIPERVLCWIVRVRQIILFFKGLLGAPQEFCFRQSGRLGIGRRHAMDQQALCLGEVAPDTFCTQAAHREAQPAPMGFGCACKEQIQMRQSSKDKTGSFRETSTRIEENPIWVQFVANGQEQDFQGVLPLGRRSEIQPRQFGKIPFIEISGREDQDLSSADDRRLTDPEIVIAQVEMLAKQRLFNPVIDHAGLRHGGIAEQNADARRRQIEIHHNNALASMRALRGENRQCCAATGAAFEGVEREDWGGRLRQLLDRSARVDRAVGGARRSGCDGVR
jgi:hypothetical protein